MPTGLNRSIAGLSGLIIAVSLLYGTAFADSPPPIQQIPLTVDCNKTGQPVSKYIYGQFIEHLGHCVYGGIWAEMLEDRKFYHFLGHQHSPWKITGDPNSVKMSLENVYVGEHSPQLNPAENKSCGIIQNGLGLVQNKKYTGSINLSGKGNVKVKVSLIWGERPEDRDTILIKHISGKYKKTNFTFVSGRDANDGRLEITALGTGTVYIGAVSLMPADNIEGMRADTLRELKELNAPIYRWPGGNFVSGYDWRDAIGSDRDKRPPRKNLAWNEDESDDFGLDEFMTFCRLLNTEPSITVNAGFGDAFSAAQEVEYINGSTDTPMGKLRAANGHPKPYNVTWWSIGNEMYGAWQLGHMALDDYTIKHNLFAAAMRKVDPSIKLIGVGNVGEWSEGMLSDCSDSMDLISEHFYCERENESSVDIYVSKPPYAVRGKVQAHRDYRKTIAALKGKNIRLALDEWNYWQGRWPYNLKDAMGIAAGLNAMIKNSDIVFMANYAQTVNVMGDVDTSKTSACLVPSGLALKLYREQFGLFPIETVGNTWPLDVSIAWTADRQSLTIAAVNSSDQPKILSMGLENVTLGKNGHLWRIAGTDPMAFNKPGEKRKLNIEETDLQQISSKLELPGYSISLYRLAARPANRQ